MPLLAHAFVLILPLVAGLGLVLGGLMTWALPVLIFGLVPAAELFLRGSTENLDEDGVAARRKDPRFDLLLFSMIPMQIALVLLLPAKAASFAWWELAGAVFSVGITCGGVALNVGHELGHRSTRWERSLSKLLYATTLYQHFFIEHNRGHHARVATPDDPATARQGESLYAFWLRCVPASWRSAWDLEHARLERRGLPRLSWHNEMLRFCVFQGALLLGVGLAFGPLGLACFIGAASIGVLLLETVNYVEHYGLMRQPDAAGRYGRVQPEHSWNSNRPIGRVLLFELTRHADHHAHPARPYPLLRHFDEAPQLPTGYPGMILMALVPPLFERVMTRQMEAEGLRLAG